MTTLPPPPNIPPLEPSPDPFAPDEGQLDPADAELLLIQKFDQATLDLVRTLYPQVGAAETSRRASVAYDDVRAIARASGLEHAAYATDVATARAALDARRQVAETRRLELRETLLLATEHAVQRMLKEAQEGESRHARDLAFVVRQAYAELRREYGEVIDATEDDATAVDMRAMIDPSLKTLRRIMRDPRSTPAEKIAAAMTVLDRDAKTAKVSRPDVTLPPPKPDPDDAPALEDLPEDPALRRRAALRAALADPAKARNLDRSARDLRVIDGGKTDEDTA